MPRNQRRWGGGGRCPDHACGLLLCAIRAAAKVLGQSCPLFLRLQLRQRLDVTPGSCAYHFNYPTSNVETRVRSHILYATVLNGEQTSIESMDQSNMTFGGGGGASAVAAPGTAG